MPSEMGKMWREIGRDRLQGSSHTRHTHAKAKRILKPTELARGVRESCPQLAGPFQFARATVYAQHIESTLSSTEPGQLCSGGAVC